MNYEKGNYFIVPNRKQLAGLDPQTQTLFLWICARADDDGVCFPSYTNLAKTCGMSRRTTIDKMKKLEALGFIKKKTGGFDESNTYQIQVKGGAGDALGGANDDKEVVQEMHPNDNHNNNKRHSRSFLMNLDSETLKEMTTKFKCDENEVKTKASDLYDYCQQKGRKYKDYKAFLRKALRKDFGERPQKTNRRIEIVEVNGKRVARYI